MRLHLTATWHGGRGKEHNYWQSRVLYDLIVLAGGESRWRERGIIVVALLQQQGIQHRRKDKSRGEGVGKRHARS